ncbi:ADP-ribosylation factor-like protein 2-binding protein isoform X2 [Oratosquilla oratoria]
MSSKEEVLAADTCEGSLLIDTVFGYLQDILLSEDFGKLQDEFMEQYCGCFEDEEENKLEYTSIFQEYTTLLEQHIEKELQTRLSGFNMGKFLGDLAQYEGQLDGDVMDLLLTLTDFLAFKNAMISFKKRDQNHSLQDVLHITGCGK